MYDVDTCCVYVELCLLVWLFFIIFIRIALIRSCRSLALALTLAPRLSQPASRQHMQHSRANNIHQ
jgi:hypothetical protein